MLIYGVVQWFLYTLAMDPNLPRDEQLSGIALSEATQIQARFVSEDVAILRRSEERSGIFLDGRMFTFTMPDVGLTAELNRGDARRGSRELAHAIIIRQLLENGMESCNTNADKIRWLLALLETLNKKVLLTMTLTPFRSLALNTFVNYNSEESRVALSTVDVIKVALVSDMETNSTVSLCFFIYLNATSDISCGNRR